MSKRRTVYTCDICGHPARTRYHAECRKARTDSRFAARLANCKHCPDQHATGSEALQCSSRAEEARVRIREWLWRKEARAERLTLLKAQQTPRKWVRG